VAKVLCIDGVEREDTPEQAIERAKHAHAVTHPDKFQANGAPWSTGAVRKGNKISARVKRIIIEAAELAGLADLADAAVEAHKKNNPKALEPELERVRKEVVADADERLLAYFLRLAMSEKKLFTPLLARLLPTQLTGEDGGPIVVEYKTRRELFVAFLDNGLTPPPWLADAFNENPEGALPQHKGPQMELTANKVKPAPPVATPVATPVDSQEDKS